jgi:MurNAc alpha-1-phosphate uridylyltransferase
LLNSFQKTSAHNIQKLAHLVLVNNPSYHPNGDFVLDHQGLLQLEGSNKLTYANIAVINPKIFAGVKEDVFPLSLLLKKGILAQSILGEHYQGFWDNIGTPKQLQALNQKLTSSSDLIEHSDLIEPS